MNALEIADWLENYGGDMADKSAAMLRKQDAAIRQLREALEEIKGYVLEHGAEYVVAEAALAATENL